MQYEDELLELIPMLKNYLKKILAKYEYLDIDDMFQECMLSAVQSSDRNDIRNPRSFFIGVFDNTIKGYHVRKIKEERAVENYCETAQKSVQDRKSVIGIIDNRVEKEPDLTQFIWDGLKEFEGKRRKVASFLGVHPQTVTNHKRRLKEIYENVLMEI